MLILKKQIEINVCIQSSHSIRVKVLSARGGNVVFVVAFSIEDFAGYEAETDEVADGAEDRLEVIAAKVAR